MCRNIKPLFNFEPPATDSEIQDAALQFVRKISGFTNPSKVNEEAFPAAVDKISADAGAFLRAHKNAPPRNCEAEAARRRERALRRFPGTSGGTEGIGEHLGHRDIVSSWRPPVDIEVCYCFFPVTKPLV